jgi:hypothetical protein
MKKQTIFTVIIGSPRNEDARFVTGFVVDGVNYTEEAASAAAIQKAKEINASGKDAFVGMDSTHYATTDGLLMKKADDYKFPPELWWTSKGDSIFKQGYDAGVF